MDFITDLPNSEGYKNLLVITDRLSKGAVLIPLRSLDVDHIVEEFLRYYIAYHYFLDTIVSDRGFQFISKFWKRLCEIARVQRRLSTAHHPQTDGSTERINAIIEAILRTLVNYKQTD